MVSFRFNNLTNPKTMINGINDEVFARFVELCEVLHIGPLAISALGEMLYEIYYEGFDNGCRTKIAKEDLRVGIEQWKETIKNQSK